MDRTNIREFMEQDRVACLMVSRDLLLFLGDHLALLLRTDSDLHECLIDISLENIAAGLLCSENCRLI